MTDAIAKNSFTEGGIQRLRQRVGHYMTEALSESTRKAYQSDWARWEAFCQSMQAQPLPAEPQVVALFAATLADEGKAVSTIERALAAITKAHELRELQTPCSHAGVKMTMKGIRRELGVAPQQVAALSPGHLKAMVEALDFSEKKFLRSVRDHALLLVGFAGGFRRSELAGLRLEDLEATQQGYIVRLRRSKTDQEGQGRVVGVPRGADPRTCPSRRLKLWIESRGTEPGALFCAVSQDGMSVKPERHIAPRTVARIVQRCAVRAGINDWVAGHSLRAGLVTSAAKARKPLHAITAQTGHKSVDMVLRYIRRAEIWDDNAASDIGL